MKSFWRPGNGEPAAGPMAPQNAARAVSSNGPVPSKPTLSKNVMAMKFMKRKADNDQTSLEEEEKRKRLFDSHWPVADRDATDNDDSGRTGQSRFKKETDDLMAALPGRRSFGGFNKAVERHYEQIMDEKRLNRAAERANKNAVSDEEMLARYESLIGLPRGPNQGVKQQRDHHSKNRPDDGHGGRPDSSNRKTGAAASQDHRNPKKPKR
jgi:M-phase phosphoprotein 6